jgi:hypothetical protein
MTKQGVTFWKSILILFSHLCLCHPSALFPSVPLIKTLYTLLLSPIRATWPAQLILLEVITRTIFVWDTGCKAPHYVVFSNPLSDQKPRRVHMSKTSPMRATCHAQLVRLYIITLRIFVWDTESKAPHYVVFSIPLSDQKPRRVHTSKTSPMRATWLAQLVRLYIITLRIFV